MRGRLLPVLALALALAVPAAAGAGKAPGARAFPARLQVKAYDFGFILSRPSVRAGRVTVEFLNTGEDAHNLRLKRLHTRDRTLGTRDIERTERVTRTFRLRAGTWRLFCSLPGHAKAGMKARLRVRRAG